MSGKADEAGGVPDLREAIAGLRTCVEALEEEEARLNAELPGQRTGNWRAALERLQRGWRSMEPELQAEALAALEEAERRSRFVLVDG